MSVCAGGEKGPDDPRIPALTRVEPAAGAARDAKRRGDWEGRASRIGPASAPPPPSPCPLPLEAGRSQFSIQGFRVSGKERRLPSSRGCPDLLLKLHAQGQVYSISPGLDFLICKMGMMKCLVCAMVVGFTWGYCVPRVWPSPCLQRATHPCSGHPKQEGPTRTQDWDLGWS